MLNIKIIPKNSTIIVGFSGGPDSVYLLLLLKQIQSTHNLKIIAAHLDHQWRPESGKDAAWCNIFCKNHNIAIVSKKASEIETDLKSNGSKEQQARNIRRMFFAEIKNKYPNSFIALAHHKDDQIETFFIRLARGTSLSGLVGIKQVNNYYLRPLLNISKTDILTYLEQQKISFLLDSTNQDYSYLRNRIRHLLIPTLPQIDNRLQKNIFTTMQHLEKTDAFLKQITEQTIKQISLPNDRSILNIEQFLQLHEILQQRILLQLLIQAQANFTPSQGLFAEIIRFLQSNKHQQHIIHQTYKVIKQKNKFSIIQQ